jgi:hypothetical protein
MLKTKQAEKLCNHMSVNDLFSQVQGIMKVANSQQGNEDECALLKADIARKFTRLFMNQEQLTSP